MREAQSRYDKHPYAALLAERRHAEKAVDNEIARVKAILHERQNPRLWDDGPRTVKQTSTWKK